jgi:hypothetical protein
MVMGINMSDFENVCEQFRASGLGDGITWSVVVVTNKEDYDWLSDQEENGAYFFGEGAVIHGPCADHPNLAFFGFSSIQHARGYMVDANNVKIEQGHDKIEWQVFAQQGQDRASKLSKLVIG